MARYDWPDDLPSPASGLEDRAEVWARRDNREAIPAGNGDLEALGAVIEAGFDAERRWMPLGPAIMRNGQATGSPIVSGRVRDLQVHPTGRRAYVGSANGGVWYTDDAGDSWSPLGSWALAATASRDGLILTVGSLLVQWGEDGDGTDNPDRDVVYVGTGELLPYFGRRPGAKHGGIGVLRLNVPLSQALETPGGNPWTLEAGNLLGQGIYRLASDPATRLGLETTVSNRILAATSSGLYLRDGPFVEHQEGTGLGDWTFVDFAGGIFDQNDGVACSDVLWNDQGLFVALMGSENEDGVYLSTDGPTGTFVRIELPDLDPGKAPASSSRPRSRISLAHAPHETRRIYVVSRRTPPLPGDDNINLGLAHGWLIDLAHTPASVPATPGVVAVEIADWPVGIYTSTVTQDSGQFVIRKDQSHYDQAVVVTEDAGSDVVFVGGKSTGTSPFDAAIYRLPITGTAAAGNLSAGFADGNQLSPAADPNFVGSDIHADVHALRMAGNDLWVGCDGGVFLRDAAGNVQQRNVGLPTAEPGYVWSHPAHDGQLIAGTQDNGTIMHEGGAVWRLIRKGDGGGCLYHPTRPHLSLGQSTHGGWRFFPARDPLGPASRHVTRELWDTEKTESKRAAAYSAAAVAPGETDDLARVFIGTDRIWMSEDWGPHGTGTTMTWVTIPTGTDPHPLTDSGTVNLDVIFERLDTEQDRLKDEDGDDDPIYKIVVLSPGTAPTFTGTRLLVLCKYTIRIFEFGPRTPGAAPSWTPVSESVVNTSSGQERRSEGKRDDDIPSPFTDHMLRPARSVWTDIAAHTETTFYVTTSGQVRRANDGSLSLNQIFDTLWWYDGDGRWYPTGLLSTAPDAAAGVAGTPATAHSVIVDPANPRIVYVGTRIGVFQGVLDESAEHPSWTWRPAMENLPQTLVEDLSIFQNGDRRYLRAALVSLGMWERDISDVPHSVGRSYIRSIDYDTGRSPLPQEFWGRNQDPARLDPARVDRSPDILVRRTDPLWHPALPNEAQVAGTSSDGVLLQGTVYHAWVQAHHRDTTPLEADQMAIHLFIQPFEAADRPEDLTIDDTLRSAIWNSVRGPGLANAFPGLTLRYLGKQTPDGPLSSRRARAVHFNADLTFPLMSGAGDTITFIAVIDPANRPLQESDLEPQNGATEVTLGEILRRSPYVAARTASRI